MFSDLATPPPGSAGNTTGQARPSADAGAAVARGPRLLVIDNYDSFTYNLVQYLAELGAGVTVWRNDVFELEQVRELDPDGIVVSHGPCTPAQAGHSVEVIRRFGSSIPILGVCLGHQAIGEAFGARVTRATRLVHGKTAQVAHEGDGAFAGLPNPLVATRYHSLIVEDLTPELVANAYTVDVDESGTEHKVLMGIRHASYPVWGVQFHPESVLTQCGHELLSNFLNLTVDWRAGQNVQLQRPPAAARI